MIRIPINATPPLYGDNMSVIYNLSLSYSSLKTKHNTIAYQKVWESVSARVISIYYASNKINISDFITKKLGPINNNPLINTFMAKIFK